MRQGFAAASASRGVRYLEGLFEQLTLQGHARRVPLGQAGVDAGLQAAPVEFLHGGALGNGRRGGQQRILQRREAQQGVGIVGGVLGALATSREHRL